MTARVSSSNELPIRAWEAAALLLAGLLFVAVRLPLLSDHGSARGWNSDAGVFGLAAREIVERGKIGVFFWGQNYMGPLTSLSGAAVAIVRHGRGGGSVDPIDLRLGTMAEVALGSLFFWLGLRAALGRWPAAVAVLLLAIGPRYLFDSSLIARGDEIAFLCSGAVFWLCARSLAGRRNPPLFEAPAGCLLFGLVAGFGWWMNEGVVFILLPLALVLLRDSRVWSEVRPVLRPLDRLLVRPERLGWPRLRREALLAGRAWHLLLGAAFLLAIANQAGLPVRALYAREPILEPIAAFLLTAALGETLLRGDFARGLRRMGSELLRLSPRAFALSGGLLIGCLPVAAGRRLGWYERAYGRPSFDAGVNGLLRHLRDMAGADLWSWLGADRSLPGAVFVTGCAAGLIFFAWRRRNRIRGLLTLSPAPAGAGALAGTILLVALGFYAVALRNGGDPRYIVPAMPVAYGVAAAGLLESAGSAGRRARARGCAALALFLGVGIWSQSRQAATRVSSIQSEPDPRVLISQIRREGYSVCYAGFWEAYKLQFLSGNALRFIPWRAHDRNPAASRALAAQPGRKCLLFPDGSFREFTAADLPKSMSDRRALATSGTSGTSGLGRAGSIPDARLPSPGRQHP
ncbi:MAG: hypothetical protein ABI914_03850 [Acidobacteriota bacterium]